MRDLSVMRTLKSERGQDIVELALVLPLLLVIAMAVLDFGRAFSTYLVLTNAAREGARQASMGPYSTTVITEAALNETRGSGLADGDVTVTIVPAAAGDPVRVSVQHNFVLIGGILPFNSVPLSTTVEMVAF